jgi:hypothetical protein
LAGFFEGAKRFIVSVGLSIPLFGKLPDVPLEARRQAAYETIATTVFASMPFWILPLLGWFIFDPKPSWDEALSRGEGLVYASALLGPLIYSITRRYGKFNLRILREHPKESALSVSFPYGGAFVTITALTCAIAGFAFALQASPGMQSSLQKNGVMALSWTLMIGSTVVFFLVTCYSNMLDDLVSDSGERVIKAQPKQEHDFVASWMDGKQ